MDSKGYISALVNVSRVELSRTDFFILRRLLEYEIDNGPFSVYKIYSSFKKTLRKPKAYKNVHQWIQKLYSLDMIEEVPGSYPRGAKFYRISNGGWLNLIIDGTLRFTGYEQALIKYYDQNIFFKTFIVPYFEIDTVKYFSGPGSFLVYYLIDCCEATIIYLETVHKEWLTEKLQSQEILEAVDIDLEVKSFLMRFVMEVADKYYYPPKLHVLSQDKKFVKALKDARSDFEECYERLIGFV
jgi:hypothetical protein